MKKDEIYDFLKFLYREHVDQYGDLISALDDSAIDVLSFIYDDVHAGKEGDISERRHRLCSELDKRGLAKYEYQTISLTPEGFYEAEKRVHWAKHAFLTHWMWMFGAILTIANVATAVYRASFCT